MAFGDHKVKRTMISQLFLAKGAALLADGADEFGFIDIKLTDEEEKNGDCQELEPNRQLRE